MGSSRILENLTRQKKAMELLTTFLEEEFQQLVDRNPSEVSRIELSVQELYRQIASERISLLGLINSISSGATKLSQVLDFFSPEEAGEIEKGVDLVSQDEQVCVRQAGENQRLVAGLYDQRTKSLQFIHSKLQPQNKTTYGANGRYSKVSSASTQATFVRGRF